MFLKNFKLLILQHKILFTLLVLVQITAVSIMLFAYGTYLDNSYNSSRSEQILYNMDAYIYRDNDDNTEISMSEIKEAFPEILVDSEEGLLRVWMRSVAVMDEPFTEEEINAAQELGAGYGNFMDVVYVTTMFDIKEGKYAIDVTSEKWADSIIGNWYSEKDMNEGANVCLVSEDYWKIREADTWALSGVNYESVGHAYNDRVNGVDAGAFTCTFVIPLESLSDEMKPEIISILFDRPIVHSKYDKIVDAFKERFGDRIEFKDFATISLDLRQTYRTMMLVCILMSVIASFTICIIYRYILNKRIYMTAVYQICGATRIRAALIYIFEMLLLLVTTTIVGSIIYLNLIEPRLENTFHYFKDIYREGKKVVLMLPLAYLLIITMVTSIVIAIEMRKPPKELISEEI